MICAAWIRGEKLATLSVCFSALTCLCGCGIGWGWIVPGPLTSWRSGMQKHCEVACSGGLRNRFRLRCCGSFSAPFGSVCTQTGLQQWAAEYSFFCRSPLYHSSTTPSLVPPHLLCSLFCPAAEHGLIWRDHNNSCNSLAFSGAPQARPGRGVQCQAHMLGRTDWNPRLLSRLCGAITRSHPCPHLLVFFLPEPNPRIRRSCPHSSSTACPGSEMGHRRGEKRREKACLKLAFALMIYEHLTISTALHPPSPVLALDRRVETPDNRRTAVMELIMNDQCMMSTLQIFLLCVQYSYVSCQVNVRLSLRSPSFVWDGQMITGETGRGLQKEGYNDSKSVEKKGSICLPLNDVGVFYRISKSLRSFELCWVQVNKSLKGGSVLAQSHRRRKLCFLRALSIVEHKKSIHLAFSIHLSIILAPFLKRFLCLLASQSAEHSLSLFGKRLAQKRCNKLDRKSVV